MSIVSLAIPRYLLVAALVVAGYSIGRAILSRVAFHNWAENLAINVAMGLGVVGHLVLLLGLTGALNARATPVALAGITLASVWINRKTSFSSAPLPRENSRVPKVFLIITG